MRFGETYYFGAGVKIGKSELVNTLAAHLMTEHDLKTFMAKPEEANAKTYQMVLAKVAGRIFHDPNVEFDYEAYDAAHAQIGNRLCLLDLYQHVGWDSLRTDMLEAIGDGCRAVFIDPITNLVNGVDSGQTNTLLQEIAQDLAAIALDHQIMVFIFCHLKAPEHGPPHERGGKVLSTQFSGSRAMMRSCHMMIGMEGNKDPELDPEERNIRNLVLLEDRTFGASGTVSLQWNASTSLFSQIKTRNVPMIERVRAGIRG
jgi:twinkle protein